MNRTPHDDSMQRKMQVAIPSVGMSNYMKTEKFLEKEIAEIQVDKRAKYWSELNDL